MKKIFTFLLIIFIIYSYADTDSLKVSYHVYDKLLIKSKRQTIAGSVITGTLGIVGITTLIVGNKVNNDNHDSFSAKFVSGTIMSLGLMEITAGIVVGVPLIISGSVKKKKAIANKPINF